MLLQGKTCARAVEPLIGRNSNAPQMALRIAERFDVNVRPVPIVCFYVTYPHSHQRLQRFWDLSGA
jgi:hypothetical protein